MLGSKKIEVKMRKRHRYHHRVRRSLQSLGTVCDTRDEGYWTFWWCHRGDETISRELGGKQVNAWSMGKFVGSSKMQDGSFVDLYENGQLCDETNGP